MEYPKIQTLFFRDEHGIIIPDKFTLEEFEYLKDCPWECSEKIDGTNTRIELHYTTEGQWIKEYKGRTERAQIPAHLMDRMKELFDNVEWSDIFPKVLPDTHITIYGEGYGKKIQACGSKYLKDSVDFILFDVKVDRWWLSRSACENIADKLGIKTVPFIGYMNIPTAIDYVANGFKSLIAEDTELDAEGLVLKAPCGILRRNGDRLITKIKTRDFRKYEAKYGNTKVEQKVNSHYENS